MKPNSTSISGGGEEESRSRASPLATTLKAKEVPQAVGSVIPK